jgi:glycosyltransferase involved in cell wall biosynthesis
VSSLSLVIVAHNRLPQLQRTIISWRGYNELVIVNDGSSDGVAEWIEANHPEVTLINIPPHPYRNCSVARNTGVAKAKHELVVIQCAEILHASDVIGYIRERLEMRNGIVVTPKAILFEQMGLRPHVWRDSERYSIIGMHKADYIAIGGMNEWYTQWGNEDHEFATRCEAYGYELIADHRIKSRHLAHPPAEGDAERFERESKFQGVYAQRLKDGKAKPVLPWRH